MPVFKGDISLGNLLSVGTTLVAVVGIIIWLQADVRELRAAVTRAENRVDKIEMRAEADRSAIADIKADIRVIRTLLEAQQPPRTGGR